MKTCQYCGSKIYAAHCDTVFQCGTVRTNGESIRSRECVNREPLFVELQQANAHSIILAHNHPSGDPTPSESDIRATREMIRAGNLLKINVLDHVIVGDAGKQTSLRELGHFYNV